MPRVRRRATAWGILALSRPLQGQRGPLGLTGSLALLIGAQLAQKPTEEDL